MTNQFTWTPIYQELADQLAKWQHRQTELIAFLENLRAQQYVISPLSDKNEDGSRFLLKEIDPFTFFGVFNRGIRQEQRIGILAAMKKLFGLSSALPDDFNGIPVLNNQKSWFIPYQSTRDVGDVERLWRVFQQALQSNPLENEEFLHAFEDALKVKHTNVNLTMGLFWIRPDTFLNLDQTNRAYLQIKLPSSGLSAKFYRDTVKSISAKTKSLPELSYKAWQSIKQTSPQLGECSYWLVGAYWSDNDPADQTERFLHEGIWENGYEDRYLDKVRSMKVGDKIAIKAAATQRDDLPFDARGKTVSRITIKAIGTIVANRNDGRLIEVEWEAGFKEKVWFFFTYQKTVWHLRTDKDYRFKEYSERLIKFVWLNQEQDYDWFCKRWFSVDDPDVIKNPYSIEDIVASGIFLTKEELKQIIDRLRSKKTMILQGPPGVGKTFIARKVVYALIEEVDNERLEMVQFHQSYSYDDFIRGYRPLPDQAGRFGLQNGVFYDFCQKAINDPDRDYVFIIDEINRGNLSQIFGELLMLIESDKRGVEFALPLVYHKENEARFYLPHNLYLIGLMNVADRSLAMVDYALRRRFAFVTLKPQYNSQLYRKWLLDRSMDSELVNLIIERMSAINTEIYDDQLLGENFQIGHSFFCPKGDNFSGLDRNWYNQILHTEIIPLLNEYWFDNHKRAEEAAERLLAG